MNATRPGVGRLAALGLLGGIVQLTAISQITLFGVPADLSPLLVASVGLLWGRSPGAPFGFGLGLFVDIALLQTLGVTSLLFTISATGPGVCASCATPPTACAVAVGAAATAVARSASRSCSSCSAPMRRSRCCSCARSS